MDTDPTVGKENYEKEIPSQYIEPEYLSLKDEEILLKEGLVSNIRPIENLSQPVPAHADQVFVGDIEKHADQIFEAEIVLPDGKKLLAVFKPDSGANKGTETGKKPVPVSENSSPNSHKEVAAWHVAQHLNLEHISMPAVLRSLDSGEGSLRPYIYGRPTDQLSSDETDQAYSDQETMEDIALYDYLLQTMDRRDVNLVWEKAIKGKRQMKVIDHSLTFFDEHFTKNFNRDRGPRLMVAYDNSKETPVLKKTPLPDRLVEKLHLFIENGDTIKTSLSELLNSDEIEGVFTRATKCLEAKTFL